MMNLLLEEDERILIRSGNILWISDFGRKLEELILTDRGLYCCYKEKKGFLGKAEPMVYRFELSDIVTEETCSHIEQVRAGNERCIQIEFRHGVEHFSFQRVPRRVMEEFFICFQNVLGVPDLTTLQKQHNKEMLANLAGDVIDGVGSIIGAGTRAISDTIGKMTDPGRPSGRYRSPDQSWTAPSGSAPSRSVPTGPGPSRSVPSGPGSSGPMPSGAVPPGSASAGPAPAADPENAYYLAIDGQQTGPLGIEEIEELARSGQVNRETLAWTRGMAEWRPMEEIGGLRKVTEAIPPKLM